MFVVNMSSSVMPLIMKYHISGQCSMHILDGLSVMGSSRNKLAVEFKQT